LKLKHFHLAFNAFAVVLSGCRGSWLSLAVVLFYFLVLKLFGKYRNTIKTYNLKVILFYGALSLIYLSTTSALFVYITSRITGVAQESLDISTQARVLQNQSMIDLIRHGDWFGYGISASGRVGVLGGINSASTNNVGSNWVLSLIVDTGIFCIPFLTLVIYFFIKSKNNFVNLTFMCVTTNALVSNTFYQPIFWLTFSLLIFSSKNILLANTRIDK
jgi:hypothetical protein